MRHLTLSSFALAMTIAATGAAETAVETPVALQPQVQTAEWAGWWPDRHKQKLAERDAVLAEGKPLRLVFVGDSITHSWESAGKALWDERFAPHGAMNIGFSGDRTEHVLWRLGVAPSTEEDNEAAGLTPDVWVVMIGTNNTGHRQDAPEDIAAGVAAIVDRLLEIAPESRVLLQAIFPRGATTEDPLRQINTAANEMIEKLGARPRVDFVDLSDVFLADDGELPKSIMPDLLHPNGEGYRLWADALTPHLERLLEEE